MLCPPTPFVAPRENALRNKTPPLREGLLLAPSGDRKKILTPADFLIPTPWRNESKNLLLF